MKRGSGAGVIQRFLAFLSDTAMAGSRTGVAFSGGPDSTALAICAAEAAKAGLLKPVLVHVDHGVRSDSAADRAIVRSTAAALGGELIEVRLDTLSARSTEAEMRETRYVALHDALAAVGVNRVMTGHHARDQAETVLLHLVRGQGAEGAGGIDPRETLFFGSASIDVIRPFLAEEPDALRVLVASRGLEVVIDHTNAELDRARNLIRHRALPVLAEINPRAIQNIARSAEVTRAEDELLGEVARGALASLAVSEAFHAARLVDHPVAIQRRALRCWVQNRTGLTLTFDRTEALRKLALSGVGEASLELGDCWSARQRKRQITLHRDVEPSGRDRGVGA